MVCVYNCSMFSMSLRPVACLLLLDSIIFQGTGYSSPEWIYHQYVGLLYHSVEQVHTQSVASIIQSITVIFKHFDGPTQTCLRYQKPLGSHVSTGTVCGSLYLSWKDTHREHASGFTWDISMNQSPPPYINFTFTNVNLLYSEKHCSYEYIQLTDCTTGDTDTGEAVTDTNKADTDSGKAVTNRDTREADTDTGEDATDTSEADTDTGEDVTDTSEEVTDTGEADTDTGEDVTDTSEDVTDTGEDATDTGEADTDTGEAVTDTSEDVTDTGEAVTDTGKAVTDTGKAVTDTDKAVTDTGEDATDTGKADTDTGEAVTDTDKAVTDTDKAVTDTGKAVTDTGKAVTDTDKAVTDTGEDATDTGEAVMDTDKAVTDTDKAVTDTGKAVTDTGKAVTDTDKAVTDTGKADTNTDPDYGKYCGSFSHKSIIIYSPTVTMEYDVTPYIVSVRYTQQASSNILSAGYAYVNYQVCDPATVTERIDHRHIVLGPENHSLKPANWNTDESFLTTVDTSRDSHVTIWADPGFRLYLTLRIINASCWSATVYDGSDVTSAALRLMESSDLEGLTHEHLTLLAAMLPDSNDMYTDMVYTRSTGHIMAVAVKHNHSCTGSDTWGAAGHITLAFIAYYLRQSSINMYELAGKDRITFHRGHNHTGDACTPTYCAKILTLGKGSAINTTITHLQPAGYSGNGCRDQGVVISNYMFPGHPLYQVFRCEGREQHARLRQQKLRRAQEAREPFEREKANYANPRFYMHRESVGVKVKNQYCTCLLCYTTYYLCISTLYTFILQ